MISSTVRSFWIDISIPKFFSEKNTQDLSPRILKRPTEVLEATFYVNIALKNVLHSGTSFFFLVLFVIFWSAMTFCTQQVHNWHKFVRNWTKNRSRFELTHINFQVRLFRSKLYLIILSFLHWIVFSICKFHLGDEHFFS